MSNVRYIALDCETGGLDPSKHAMLTLYMAAVTKDLIVADEIYLKIRPESPSDMVEAEALKVNGLDMRSHLEDPETLSRLDAAKVVYRFLSTHSSPKNKPLPLGHNVDFDLNFIYAQIMPRQSLEKLLHYHKMDTMAAVNLLKEVGMLPPELGRLTSLVKHFGIKERTAHNAKEDTLATIDVFAKMTDMLKNMSSAGSQVDVLSLLEP